MSKLVAELCHTAGLADIHDKVREGTRLSYDDGVRLFHSRELMAVGALANLVRERRHGDDAFFVRNMHLNPTNVCTVDCKFCGFYRPYREKERGWTWSLDRCLQEVERRLAESVSRNTPLRPEIAAEFPALAIEDPLAVDYRRAAAARTRAVELAMRALAGGGDADAP